MGHRVPVSRALAEAVFERDRDIVMDYLAEFGYVSMWDEDRVLYGLGVARTEACPAVVMDIDELSVCRGRWTIEHVPDTATMKMGMLIRGMRRGKRAENDLRHMVALCQAHTEPGMKGGHVWNTAHRSAIRDYLEKANA